MDDLTANQFIASLVKSMQALCNGYIDFNSSIEVVGHIHLNIDRKTKLDYVLTEEVSKSVSEDATLFSSHSYHSKPPHGLTSENLTAKSEKASAPVKSGTSNSGSRRKTHQVPREDDSETISFSTVPQVTSHIQVRSDSSLSIHADESFDSTYSDNVGFSHDSNSLQTSEKESNQTLPRCVQSSLDRRRKGSASDFVTSAMKHRRIAEASVKSEPPSPVEEIHIKEEPEDIELIYHSSSDDVTGQDISTPDFSSVVMESLDHVGQKNLASFMTGGKGRQQMQQAPFPVMLHSSPDTSVSVVPLPGPSTSTAPVPSASAVHPVLYHKDKASQSQPSLDKTDIRGGGVEFEGATEMVQAGVQTPYTVVKNLKGKTSKRGRKRRRGKLLTAVSRPGKRRVVPPSGDKSNYLEYTVEDMNEAIELIHGGMSVIDAALKYGIPRATLFNRSRDGCKTHSGRCSEVFLRTHVGEDYPKKRLKQTYTAETMEKAIEAVHNGMPVIDAAIRFDIPRASLFIRSGKGCPTHTGRCSTVSTNGKLKRTKVSRFRYLQLMEEKSALKSPPSAEESSREVIPAKYNPKVTLMKIQGMRTAEQLSKAATHPLIQQALMIKSGDTERQESPDPVLEASTSAPVSEEASETALQNDDVTVFDDLSGTVVVKIEKVSDD